MSDRTETETVKAAKKSHRCSWCPERIDIGSEYRRYRYFNQGDAGTVKMHPECYEAMLEAARNECGDFEYFPGENPRGCTCGFSDGCEFCEAREASKRYPEAEYSSWVCSSLAYRAFCAGCAYCLHGECTFERKTSATLSWE